MDGHAALIDQARSAWRAVPLLPAVLAAFPILVLYLESGVSVLAALRFLIASVIAITVAWALIAVVLRDRNKAVLAAVLLFLSLFVWRERTTLILVAVLLLVVVAVLPRVLRVHFPWALVTSTGNVLASMLLLLVLVRAAGDGTLAQLPRDMRDAAGRAAPAAAAMPGLPDVYLIMLEDYPRADTLERVFGFDDTPFLDALTTDGFTVSRQSRSNYSNSQLTLLTMFQARHIEDIPELDSLRNRATDRQYPLIRALTNQGDVFGWLREAGYSITATSSGFEQLAIRGADRFVDSGQLNDFEIAYLRESALADIGDAVAPSLVGDQQRGRILDELAFLTDTVRHAAGGPQFVFVHVPAPHPPVVFGPGGEHVEVPLTQPYGFDIRDSDAFKRAYVGQIEYLGRLVLEALGAAPPARPSVVIVMTDEGFGAALDPVEAMRPVDSVATLFAARAPGGEALFPQWVTPVNVFPILLNRYAGRDVPIRPDRNWISLSTRPFDGTELPNLDAPPQPAP